AKFATVNLPETKLLPEQTLGIGWVFSQLAGSRSIRSYPLSFPLPARGKGIGPIKTPELDHAIQMFDMLQSPLPRLLRRRPTQRQLLIDQTNRSLGVRSMLTRPRAAARMMRD